MITKSPYRFHLLCIALTSVFCLFLVANASAESLSPEDAKPTAEHQDEFTFALGDKRLTLREGLKLSEAFDVLGDPEDIGHVNSPNRLYGWRLAADTGPSLIIDANPREDVVADWLVAWYENGKLGKMICFAHPGKSRKLLSVQLKSMKHARITSNPVCPAGLWCTTFNRSQEHGHPFEILRDRDVVGPSLWVTLQFAGVGSIPIPDDLAQRVSLTVETPHGKKYTINIKGPVRFRGKELGNRSVVQVSASFFSWVTPDMPDSEVPIGRYRYYATFLGARSRTAEVTVHRQAIVLPSPNDKDMEIAITPFYDKLPIHGLKYEDLVSKCKARLKQKFEGKAEDLLISAYEFLEFDNSPISSAVMKISRHFPLRVFGTVEVRKTEQHDEIQGDTGKSRKAE